MQQLEIAKELALLGVHKHLGEEISMIKDSKRSYKLRYKNSFLVLKKFDEKNLYDRELYALIALGRNNCHCPNLINYDDQNSCILYEFVQGTTLYEALNKYSVRKLIRIFEELGEELRRVHTVDVHPSLQDYPDYKNRQIKETEYIYSRIAKDQYFNQPQIIGKAINETRKGYSLYDLSDQLSLIHNDLNSYNIIVKETGLKSIIDYEQCSPGIIYSDFISFRYYALNSKLEKAFIRGYKGIPLELYNEFTKYYFLCDILKNCFYCHGKNESMFNYYLNILEKS